MYLATRQVKSASVHTTVTVPHLILDRTCCNRQVSNLADHVSCAWGKVGEPATPQGGSNAGLSQTLNSYLTSITHTRTILMCITSTCRSSKPNPASSSGEDFSFQAPTHPWSVSNPRFLATPTASQPPTLTMHASAAAAPVGPGSASASSSIPPAQHMAMSQPASEANTAIPAIVPDAQDSGDLACPCSAAPNVLCCQWGLMIFCVSHHCHCSKLS